MAGVYSPRLQPLSPGVPRERRAREFGTSGGYYFRQMDTMGRKMIERDFVAQAKLSQHLKDIRLILDGAGRIRQ